MDGGVRARRRLERPRLYGAGLLSPASARRSTASPRGEEAAAELACADTEYDITRMQPQLFVARDFEHLFEVLDEFEATLGVEARRGLRAQEALRARR